MGTKAQKPTKENPGEKIKGATNFIESVLRKADGLKGNDAIESMNALSFLHAKANEGQAHADANKILSKKVEDLETLVKAHNAKNLKKVK